MILLARRTLVVLLILASAASAWDPDNGDWSKSDSTDLRVMTWNVLDGIRSGNAKTEGFNNWTALARIIASLQPDILLLQEVGDNGCFNCVDSIADLEVVFDLLFNGGEDPFLGGTVTAYVQKYAPGYDLPHVFASSFTDGFNRNVIVSRFSFTDLNGDTKSTLSDIPLVVADLYAPGGNGGIRGFQFAEIDLPAPIYAGDVVIGNAHLKAGGSSSDRADRLKASQNVAYVIDYWYNGADDGIPDPRDKIFANPPATTILDDDTPVIMGGDWNEDELTNGRRGPAAWLTQAAVAGGTDGTDRDRSDMTYDSATHLYTGNRATFSSSSKLDYIAHQDSIAVMRREFIFDTSGTPSGALPTQLTGFSFPSGASGAASDHRPVVVDFILPLASPCTTDQDCDDGVFCNGFEICDGNGACQPGSPPDCDDGIACTVDVCGPLLDECVHTPDPDYCDNDQYCDGPEVCDAQLGCQPGTPPCGISELCNEAEQACLPVPAVSTWGLCILSLMTMSVGTIFVGRNRSLQEGI